MLLGAYCWMLIMRILIEWFCWMVVEGFSLIDHVDAYQVVLFNEPVHLLKAVLNVFASCLFVLCTCDPHLNVLWFWNVTSRVHFEKRESLFYNPPVQL